MNDATRGPLFRSLQAGALRLPNRIVMSPMTRLRADEDGAPTELMAEYYAQRAGAGLIVSEAMAVRPYGEGFPNLPGIHRERQQEGWRRVVERVHAAGGRIAAQLWDVGRARTGGAGRDPWWGVTDPVKPAELSDEDLAGMLDGFARGASAARAAGFDAVEVHAGSANLLDRFLRASTNLRVDRYGGSHVNRLRLLQEILDAVEAVMGAQRVGLKLSPSAAVAGGPDELARGTFAAVLAALSDRGLAYLHLTRPTAEDRERGGGPGLALAELRPHYRGTLIGAGDFTQAEAERAIAEGWLDAVAFGRLYIANPDLHVRFAAGAALNEPDRATFYSPGPAGLVDYPRLSA